jgi:low affinity Fe/Cu permease
VKKVTWKEFFNSFYGGLHVFFSVATLIVVVSVGILLMDFGMAWLYVLIFSIAAVVLVAMLLFWQKKRMFKCSKCGMAQYNFYICSGCGERPD